jgi:disulfide bond formation protein DsbB
MTTPQSLRADYVAIAAGAAALALILGALGFQYLGGLAPCEMCHWQRWPHIAAALIGILGGGFLPRRYGVPLAMAVILLVATSGLIGLYQTLGQYGLVPMPLACHVGHAFMLGAPAPPEPSLFQRFVGMFTGFGEGASCSLPTWFFLGLALPAWNVIFSFLIAGSAIVALMRGNNAPQA